MKILKVTPFTGHHVNTDQDDFPKHTRYGPESWMVTMGESEEVVAPEDCAALEAEFQRMSPKGLALPDGTVLEALHLAKAADSCALDDTPLTLQIVIEDAGAGPYLVLRTNRWALANDAEVEALAATLKLGLALGQRNGGRGMGAKE